MQNTCQVVYLFKDFSGAQVWHLAIPILKTTPDSFSLKELWLRNNKISGAVPAFRSTTFIDLAYNELEGAVIFISTTLLIKDNRKSLCLGGSTAKRVEGTIFSFLFCLFLI